MGIKVNSGRQEVVAATVDFDFSDLESGVDTPAIHHPGGAILLPSLLVVLTPWDSGTSDALNIGDGDTPDSYASGVDLQAAGVTEIPATGEVLDAGSLIANWVGSGTAPTQGKARIVLRYVVEGREAFSHGPDFRLYEQ